MQAPGRHAAERGDIIRAIVAAMIESTSRIRAPGLPRMPFTFAHPAAAAPLQRPLGRYGVLSALVIGSMSPDFSYFLPLGVRRLDTHSFTGLVLFCLPAALAVYVAWHVLLKGPLLALLPRALLGRLDEHARNYRSLPSRPWSAVLVSLLVGAVTHLVWDAFTHPDTLVTRNVAFLRLALYSTGPYEITVYNALQLASTAAGLALLGWWCLRWLRRATPQPAALPVCLSPRRQCRVVASALAVIAGVAVWAGSHEAHGLHGVAALRTFGDGAIFGALQAFTLSLVLYAAAWHVAAIRVRTRTS